MSAASVIKDPTTETDEDKLYGTADGRRCMYVLCVSKGYVQSSIRWFKTPTPEASTRTSKSDDEGLSRHRLH